MVHIAKARIEILASGTTDQHNGDKCRRVLHFWLLDFGAEEKVTWEMSKLFYSYSYDDKVLRDALMRLPGTVI